MTSLSAIVLLGMFGSLVHEVYVSWTYDPDKHLKAWFDKKLLPLIPADSVLRERVQTEGFRAQMISDCHRLGKPPIVRVRVSESKTWSQIELKYMDRNGNVLDTLVLEVGTRSENT